MTLSQDGRFLFVVNAGSNSISTFAFGGSGLVLKSVVDSGGLTPTSVTEPTPRTFSSRFFSTWSPNCVSSAGSCCRRAR